MVCGRKARQVLMKAVPLELKQANSFVEQLHRHHAPVVRDKWRIGCEEGGKLVGVVQVARPVSRGLDDGKTLEVVRLCTDGTENACSYLYAKAARIAKEMGYARIITYILESESGASLKASGWVFDGMTRGGAWDTPSRRRQQKAPTCPKQRWIKTF